MIIYFGSMFKWDRKTMKVLRVEQKEKENEKRGGWKDWTEVLVNKSGFRLR